MYRSTLLIFFIAFTFVHDKVMAQNQIKWLTWQEALDKSKIEKKKIFVDVYTDWCGWCKKMDKSTFSEDQIARYVNANYYAVKFDAEMKTPVNINGREYGFTIVGNKVYHELAIELLQGKMSYPSILFLDENLQIIQPIPGYQDAKTFEMIITYFGKNVHQTTPWHTYMRTFRRDEHFNVLTKE